MRLGYGLARSKSRSSIPGKGKIMFPPVGPTQPSIQEVPCTVSLAVKRLWRESDYSPPSRAKIKNGGIPQLPPYVFMA